MTNSHDADTGASGPSRRDFLKFVTVLAGSVGLQALPQLTPATSAATADPRAYSASRFALELDGALVDFVRSVEGGFPRGEVAQEKLSTAAFAKKHLPTSNIRTSSCKLTQPCPTPFRN